MYKSICTFMFPSFNLRLLFDKCYLFKTSSELFDDHAFALLLSSTLPLGFLGLGQQALTRGFNHLCRNETERLSEKKKNWMRNERLEILNSVFYKNSLLSGTKKGSRKPSALSLQSQIFIPSF